MKFLCLAYGDEAGWNSLTEEDRRGALARDVIDIRPLWNLDEDVT